MKLTLATSLLGLAMLSACTTAPKMTQTDRVDSKAVKSTRYASNNSWNGQQTAAPDVGSTADIPAEGPADISRNPELVPSPLLRQNAIGNP